MADLKLHLEIHFRNNTISTEEQQKKDRTAVKIRTVDNIQIHGN